MGSSTGSPSPEASIDIRDETLRKNKKGSKPDNKAAEERNLNTSCREGSREPSKYVM